MCVVWFDPLFANCTILKKNNIITTTTKKGGDKLTLNLTGTTTPTVSGHTTVTTMIGTASPAAITPVTTPTALPFKSFLPSSPLPPPPVTPPPSLVSNTSTTAVHNSLPDQSTFLLNNGSSPPDSVTVTHFSEQKGGIVEKISVPSASILDAALTVEKLVNLNPFLSMSSGPSSPTSVIAVTTPSKTSTNPFHNISSSSSGNSEPSESVPSSPPQHQLEFKSSNPFKDVGSRARSKSPAVITSRGTSPSVNGTSKNNGTTAVVELKDLRRTPSFAGKRRSVELAVPVEPVTATTVMVSDSTDAAAPPVMAGNTTTHSNGSAMVAMLDEKKAVQATIAKVGERVGFESLDILGSYGKIVACWDEVVIK